MTPAVFLTATMSSFPAAARLSTFWRSSSMASSGAQSWASTSVRADSRGSPEEDVEYRLRQIGKRWACSLEDYLHFDLGPFSDSAQMGQDSQNGVSYYNSGEAPIDAKFHGVVVDH